MESETNSNKRKRLDEESDESKQEKRPRLDDTFKKHDETLRNNNTTAVSKAQKPLLDNINDTESDETEQDESYRCITVSESKKEEKENAVLINMHAKSDAFILPVIENEKEDSAIETTASARSLDSRDDLNDDEVRDSDVILSPTCVSESKNDDQSKGRETKAEEVNLEIKSDTGKGGDIKFDTIDDVQEEEASLDNCVEHQNQINLQETGISNKGPISPVGVLKDSNVQIQQRDVSDANLMENECKNLVSTTESENQSTTSEAPGQEDNAIDEERFLYRLLRPGESYNMGIEPKNVYSNTSINNHVANGSSNGLKSRYISCSKTRDAINRFASYINPALRFQLRHIVRIDKTKLDDDCEIYDLTEESVSTRYLKSEFAKRYARDYAEVLLAPSREIPVWCFILAGSVQDGKINWIAL
ncbi:uncharacterized protein LOC128171695 [Crassostrea angulata]|uniref:uncharacterized protein LOC128171695 n=1 Tax=Magallana angulata TaxID=2784310 RepID=UPI0022B1DAAE|nr:uncharacterized protein LOC128171695 [Crassostrea angulata]